MGRPQGIAPTGTIHSGHVRCANAKSPYVTDDSIERLWRLVRSRPKEPATTYFRLLEELSKNNIVNFTDMITFAALQRESLQLLLPPEGCKQRIRVLPDKYL